MLPQAMCHPTLYGNIVAVFAMLFGVLFLIGHNYIGHNYIVHNYIGHNYTGHNYTGHNYIGHNNYIGHTYIDHNYIGDVSPNTVYGKIVAVFAMLFGVLFLAMPISIMGNNFVQYINMAYVVMAYIVMAVPCDARFDHGQQLRPIP